MPPLSRYANKSVSCGLHLYQPNTMLHTWLRPIHISAACVSGRVPVATDPCPQASSFCSQVSDTSQLALFHVHIVHDGEEAACLWDSLDANLPANPPASQKAAPSEGRAVCYSVLGSVDAQIRSLGQLVHGLQVPASVDGMCGHLICSTALCNGMSVSESELWSE